MKLLKKLFRPAQEQKQPVIGSDLAIMGAGNAVWTPANYRALSKQGYINNAIAHKAISEIAKACSTVPLYVQNDRTGEEGEHPVLSKLLERPNRECGIYEVLFEIYAFKCISGNAYIQFGFTGDGGQNNMPAGEIASMYVLNPERMKVVPGADGYVEAYEHTVNGRKRLFGVDPRTNRAAVLHIKEFHPLDDWYGLSPLEAAMRHVDMYNQGNDLNLSLLQNGARLTTALKFADGFADDEQRDQLRADFIRSFTGAANAGRPVMLEGGIEIQELGQSPKEIEFLEGNLAAARTIALTLGLPPFMLGLPGDNTFNNMREAKQHFYLNTVKPDVEHVLTQLNNYLRPFIGEGFSIAADWDSVEAFNQMRAEQWERLKTADFLTINEKREALGYAPVDDQLANQIWQPVGSMPISFSGALPEMPQEEDAKALPNDIEFKLINDLSEVQRSREVQIAGRLMDGLERRFASQVARLLDRQAKEAADSFQEDVAGFNAATVIKEDELLAMYEAHYRRTARLFGDRVLDGFKSFTGGFEKKDRESIFEAALLRFIEDNAATKVKQVSDYTRDLIKAAIFAGEEAAETRREIAKRIVSQTGGSIAAMRAKRIAATETHSAAMFGQDAAADATGLELTREWISAEDSRARPSHAQANGQKRAKNVPFDVGGHKMVRPGDPDAPAGEIVNCRCVVGYLTVDAE